MNTPVSFEIDKLLIKKGIDMPVSPIISDVVMWLYEKHGIWIEVTTDVNAKFCWLVKQLRASNNNFKSPTEAYEDAIDYVLKNLV